MVVLFFSANTGSFSTLDIILLCIVAILSCMLIIVSLSRKKYKPQNDFFDKYTEKNIDGFFDESENCVDNLENQFDLVANLAEVGVLLIKVDTKKFYLSKLLREMLGTDKKLIDRKEIEDFIHPDDLMLFTTYCNIINSEARERKISSTRQMDLRIKTNGGFHWYRSRYKLTEIGGSYYVGSTLVDISDAKEKDAMIEKMAFIDNITQIYNRNRFLEIGEEAFECAKEIGVSYWLIIVDFDKFHIINDTCGYKKGNRLLKDFARELIRHIDTSAFCARIGGDNFAVIIRNTGDNEAPRRLYSDLSNALNEMSSQKYYGQTLTISAGYCRFPEDGADFTEVFEHAEFALRLGGNPRSNFTCFKSDAHKIILQGNAMENELEKALNNNELKLFYQPKINLDTKKIIGIEALVRWIKKSGEIVMPGVFIPVAENSMLITRISDFVIREACAQNKKWHDMGFADLTVSVNLSSVDFYQTDVCELIRKALRESGLEAKYLEIELTESLALKDVEMAISQMVTIRDDIGVKISMDDFGTGYSSLSYIQILPISLLKLDRSFISQIEDDVVSREIVSSVVNIAKSKKIETIAEGIETESQAKILMETGCDHAQGFFFGKPMPANEMDAFLTKYVTKQCVST